MNINYVKIVGDNSIEYAPTNYVDENGTILNFDTSVEFMISKGYKPLEDSGAPVYNPEYETLNIGYSEDDGKIVRTYSVTSNIMQYKAYLLLKVDEWYKRKENELIPVGNNFVKTEWFGTYSNVYQALKFAEENSILIEPSAVIVASAPDEFINITVSSSSDLAPLYKAVMLKYQEVVQQRNFYLVQIQESSNVQELQEIEESLEI